MKLSSRSGICNVVRRQPKLFREPYQVFDPFKLGTQRSLA